MVTAAGRPRRTPATTPRAASSPLDDEGAASRADPPPSWSEVERAGHEIEAAAAKLRHRLVMGRYAGFATGFDAGLAMCAILDTLARDRGRDLRSQRLRGDALRLAHHVNQDVAAESAAIEGGPPEH